MLESFDRLTVASAIQLVLHHFVSSVLFCFFLFTMGKSKKKKNPTSVQSDTPKESSPSSSYSSTISPLSIITEGEHEPGGEPGRLSETEFPPLARKEVPPDKEGSGKPPILTSDHQESPSSRSRPSFMSPEGRSIPAVALPVGWHCWINNTRDPV